MSYLEKKLCSFTFTTTINTLKLSDSTFTAVLNTAEKEGCLVTLSLVIHPFDRSLWGIKSLEEESLKKLFSGLL